MPWVAGMTEEESYIPASGERWYFLFSAPADDAWCWQLLNGLHGVPTGIRGGPFSDRSTALLSVESWIDAHQDAGDPVIPWPSTE